MKGWNIPRQFTAMEQQVQPQPQPVDKEFAAKMSASSNNRRSGFNYHRG